MMTLCWKEDQATKGDRGKKGKNIKNRKGQEPLLPPIACNTKRTESVMADNFLFPIALPLDDPKDSREGGVHAIGLLRRSRRFLFSGMKTKIGPMDVVTVIKPRNDGLAMGNSAVILSDKSEETPNKHSTNMTKEAEPNQEMVPTTTTQRLVLDVAEGSVEAEALQLLNKWGITKAMLQLGSADGARHELTGIYRIVVHRLQMRDERLLSKQITSASSGRNGEDSGSLGCGRKCIGGRSCNIL